MKAGKCQAIAGQMPFNAWLLGREAALRLGLSGSTAIEHNENRGILMVSRAAALNPSFLPGLDCPSNVTVALRELAHQRYSPFVIAPLKLAAVVS